ncbi:MAG: hypothetical protein R3B54_16335 [Bdellovibrionota bacterium]
MRKLVPLVLMVVAFAAIAASPDKDKPENKLLQMYRLYYLPFNVFFREGNSSNEIVPFVDADPNGLTKRMVKAQELQVLNTEWDEMRKDWKKRSLFLTTQVPVNKSVRITRGLMSHKISLTRTAFDGIDLNDRIKLNNALKSKTPQLQKAFKQLRFLKSFITEDNEDKFNFFVVSASWCQSCLEYRVLLESYVKRFADPKLVLHSLVLEDPKEEVFDAKVMEELFPNPKKYSHESIPRFLAYENVKGKPTVYEEGDALKALYDRFFIKHRGYLNDKISIFGKGARSLSSEKSP